MTNEERRFPNEELLEACENVRNSYMGAGIFTFVIELILFVGTLLPFIFLMDDGFNIYHLIAPLFISLFILVCLLCVVHDMYIYLYKFKYVYPKMITENPKEFIEKFSESLYIPNTSTRSGYNIIVRETKNL